MNTTITFTINETTLCSLGCDAVPREGETVLMRATDFEEVADFQRDGDEVAVKVVSVSWRLSRDVGIVRRMEAFIEVARI